MRSAITAHVRKLVKEFYEDARIVEAETGLKPTEGIMLEHRQRIAANHWSLVGAAFDDEKKVLDTL